MSFRLFCISLARLVEQVEYKRVTCMLKSVLNVTNNASIRHVVFNKILQQSDTANIFTIVNVLFLL